MSCSTYPVHPLGRVAEAVCSSGSGAARRFGGRFWAQLRVFVSVNSTVLYVYNIFCRMAMDWWAFLLIDCVIDELIDLVD